MKPQTFWQEDLAAVVSKWPLFEPNYDSWTEFTDHGPDHWERVYNNSIQLRREEGLPESAWDALYHAALFHDSMRLNESDDPGHGGRGAVSLLTLKPVTATTLLAAECCSLHTELTPWNEKEVLAHLSPGDADVVRVFVDADRLDIGRVGKAVDPMYLFTDSAKQRAEVGL